MEQLQTSLNGHSEEYLEEVGKSHYGEGTVRVHLRDLLDLDRKQSLGFLKELNKAVAQ